MRQKQLLGLILLFALASATATASVSQLSGVVVTSRQNEGLVTILASGAFTHTEYRPTDNLMLIDLAGVLLAHPDPALHSVYAPGVRSYKVVAYRAADGVAITRIELNLIARAKSEVNDIEGGIEVRLTGAPAVLPSKDAIAAAAAARSKASPMSRIEKVSVSRHEQNLEVQIAGNGPLTAKTMKLTGPDRLVVDIPNSVLDGRARHIAVDSSVVKDVRVGRFQSDPPVTRVVVDLVSAGDFDLAPVGNNLLLTLHEKTSTPVATAKTEVAMPGVQAVSAISEPVVTTAASAAVHQPAETAQKTDNAATRADVAASHFAHAAPQVATYNQPPYSNASLGVQPATVNAALQQQAAAGTSSTFSGPVSSCTSGHYTGEPIGLNFKDLDLKDFFKVIQEISGLNVVLDPAVKGTVSIYLNDVPWDQALAIVLNNNGLECQLQGNVLRIATLQTLKTEADERRAQQDAQALAVPKQTITRYMSYGQARDAVTIVKKFLSPRGDVVADPRSNALIVEDIPSTLPKIEELIKNLDRKTPEVEIEARVVASTRSFARDIGTQLAVGFATGNAKIFGAPSVGDSPIITTGLQPPTSTTTLPTTIGPSTGNLLGSGTTKGSIPLFSNLGSSGPTSGLGFSTFTNNFRLDFILSAAESRGLIKILSRPHITTQNNIAATVKQGAQIPVVTQAQLGGPPTVQYIAAFLRLTVTPQITAENTIFLNLDVENTTPDFSRVTGSQLNPALDTQQATTSVLVKDGGTVVIGGVVQTQNNLAIAQVPILGSIPMLGNLFKHQTVNTQTVELIFFITPKIIET
ncbi:MAG TPA: type IV pilus secretin PilQ [Candidatus Angelobacter sp.]|nr:type IV pilus secretin PilQ [Candidatus Angelobacter sp.]